MALALDAPLNLPDLRDVAAFLMAFGRASRARLAGLLAAEDWADARDEVSAVDTAAMTLGRPLVAARTEAELDDRIAEALQSPWLDQFLGLTFELFAQERPSLDTVVFDDSARAFRLIDNHVTRTLAQGFVLTGACALAFRNLCDVLGEHGRDQIIEAAGPWARERRVADIAADPGMPPEVARAMLSQFEALVVMLGLYELIREKGIAGCVEHPVTPWLADRWVATQRRYLRLLASLWPGLVSEEIVRPLDRMNLSAATERNRRAQASIERMPPQHLLRVEDLPIHDEDG